MYLKPLADFNDWCGAGQPPRSASCQVNWRQLFFQCLPYGLLLERVFFGVLTPAFRHWMLSTAAGAATFIFCGTLVLDLWLILMTYPWDFGGWRRRGPAPPLEPDPLPMSGWERDHLYGGDYLHDLEKQEEALDRD